MNNFAVTVLAGGQGKRMQSTLPKVLHLIKGVPMIVRIVEQVAKLNPYKIVIVVGKFKQQIEDVINTHLSKIANIIEYVVQEVPNGTGDAVKSTLHSLNVKQLTDGFNVILNGDTPCISYEMLNTLVNSFIENRSKSQLQITAIKLEDPTGCGRIIKDETGVFQKIVEEKDCTDEQLQIKLVNVGVYIATVTVITEYIPLIQNNNAQKEYYLTDIVELYKKDETKERYNTVGLYELPESSVDEIVNVNTKEQLDILNNKQ